MLRQALRRCESTVGRQLGFIVRKDGVAFSASLMEQIPAAASQLTSLKALQHGFWPAPQSSGYASKAGKKKQGKQADTTTAVDSSLDLKEVEGWMQQPIDNLKTNLSGIRTGRASPGMLDIIKVAAYGEQTPSQSLKSLASVAVRGPQLLAVSVYDPSTIQAVEKAIREGPLGLNPHIEGDEVLVPVPKPNKETLAAMEKLLKTEGESAKVAIRHARKRSLDAVKALGSEDDRKRLEKQVQSIVDGFVKEVDSICAAKSKELSTAT